MALRPRSPLSPPYSSATARTAGPPKRQRLYVAALAATGHVGKAARFVGMTEQSAARLRRRPEAASFAAACAAAFLDARRRWAQARLAASSPRAAEGFGFFKGQGS